MVFKNDQLLNYPASISNEPHELRRTVKTYTVSNLCAQHLHRERCTKAARDEWILHSAFTRTTLTDWFTRAGGRGLHTNVVSAIRT